MRFASFDTDLTATDEDEKCSFSFSHRFDNVPALGVVSQFTTNALYQISPKWSFAMYHRLKRNYTSSFSTIDQANVAVNNGKKAVPPKAFSRSPTALEVTEGLMFFAFDRASVEAVVTVTDVTGLQKVWDGLKAVLSLNDILTLDNSGAVDWDADDTVTVESY